MCDIHSSRRKVILGLSAFAMPRLVLAQEDQNLSMIGGDADMSASTSIGGKTRFTLKAKGQGTVLQARDQIFYLDPQTEAEFYEADTGLVSEIVIKTGGILSLFGQQSGQNVKIATFNAVGAIRGTTTYFAWQEKEKQTYVCCCYGGVDLVTDNNASASLRTHYHNAVVMPENGKIFPAPYDRPLRHFDDDIKILEEKAGRKPNWVLPHGKMNFFAPQPVPLG